MAKPKTKTFQKTTLAEAIEEFEKPFYVKWRTVRFPKQGDAPDKKYEYLPYIDARDVMDRLDDVVGPQNWSDSYSIIQEDAYSKEGKMFKNTYVECKLTVLGVTKVDVGDTTQMSPMKGAYSDALKRAAVKFKIGRFLYDSQKVWARVDTWGKPHKDDFHLFVEAQSKMNAINKKEVQFDDTQHHSEEEVVQNDEQKKSQYTQEQIDKAFTEVLTNIKNSSDEKSFKLALGRANKARAIISELQSQSLDEWIEATKDRLNITN